MSTYTVTAVIAQKNNPSRCSVFLDGSFAFGCSIDVVLQYTLRKGAVINSDTRAQLLAQEEQMQLKQKALAYATYKPRTAEQVRKKMVEKGYTPEEALYAVAFLEEFGYLNDAEFARAFIRDYLQRKPAGRQKLAEELRKRGVKPFDIEDALASVFPHDDTTELARRAAEKKLRSLASRPREKQKTALVQYLQRQGFSWDSIQIVLQEWEGEHQP